MSCVSNIMLWCLFCIVRILLTLFGGGVVFMPMFLRSMYAFLAQSVRESDVFFLDI